MSRGLSTPMLSGPGSISSNAIRPAFLVDLQFRTVAEHVWSGAGTITWNGNTYVGVGSVGKIGSVSEGSGDGLNAQGTSVTLSGINPALLAESMTDIQLGAPATIWFALFDGNLNILGSPYPLYVGTVDQPQLAIGTEEMSITLKLENRLINLKRSGMRRYTSADQNLYFPTDCAFTWVEILNDQALKWAPALLVCLNPHLSVWLALSFSAGLLLTQWLWPRSKDGRNS